MLLFQILFRKATIFLFLCFTVKRDKSISGLGHRLEKFIGMFSWWIKQSFSQKYTNQKITCRLKIQRMAFNKKVPTFKVTALDPEIAWNSKISREIFPDCIMICKILSIGLIELPIFRSLSFTGGKGCHLMLSLCLIRKRCFFFLELEINRIFSILLSTLKSQEFGPIIVLKSTKTSTILSWRRRGSEIER